MLDSNDYVDYPNPIWRNQGLHLNIKNGGVEEMSPEYLLEVMESSEYSNLVRLRVTDVGEASEPEGCSSRSVTGMVDS